ncbi:hypothetical protein L1276_004895 [Flavobacterium sp. HSC-32F16]|uniref:hypothetical protein n=1 Tax=Flavobacterium sp. HSC-32F16 TaxID=2910964 RepID=UPI0020A55D50|nr:hypothetical protein [Flavobacterium sp. HSC-32F16]MCP2029701.1 hypothetical protein [Flavobacterium sp. HSC-32F16]
MKNSKTNRNENYSCPLSKSRLYTGENNELICVKTYKGDWGDWDEKPANSNFDCSQDSNEISENTSSEEVLL